MRRLSFTWVLSLLLVFVQHGAVLHELGHLSHGALSSTATLDAPQPLDSALCPTCEAFAQIANPASAAAPDIAVSPCGLLQIPDPPFASAGSGPPTPRSRGPPQV